MAFNHSLYNYFHDYKLFSNFICIPQSRNYCLGYYNNNIMWNLTVQVKGTGKEGG